MISFANPEALWFLFLLLPVAILGMFSWRVKRKLGLLFGVLPGKIKRSQLIKYLCFVFAVALIITALAAPRIETKDYSSGGKTGEIIFLADVSRSMDARVNPKSLSRLDRVKKIETGILREFPQAKISVCGFTDLARCLTPLTQDQVYIRRTIEKVLDVNSVPGRNTNIGQSLLDVAVKFSADEKARIIVLLSDGENFSTYTYSSTLGEDVAIANAARALEENKIKLIVVGVGETAGASIPLYGEDGEFMGKYAENAGDVFVTSLDEDSLRKIAEVARGYYFSEADENGPKDLIAGSLNAQNGQEANDYRDIALFLLIPAAFFGVLYLRCVR